MSSQETNTAAGEQTAELKATGTAGRKRRGLVLPPKGQALSRLQDLEQEDAESATTNGFGEHLHSLDDGSHVSPPQPEFSNAVNTASSNAVNEEGSTSINTARPMPEGNAEVATGPPVFVPHQKQVLSPSSKPPREPTTRITVDMPDSLHRRISFLSVETRRSIKDLVIEALDATYFQPISDQDK